MKLKIFTIGGFSNGMKIDGRQIAQAILDTLKLDVDKLKEEGIIPTLLVILVGNNEQSVAYIRQKELKAHDIGARTQVLTFDESMTFDEATKLTQALNDDPNVYGIIIQRPAPESLKIDRLSDMINPKKEVDGFGKDSIYTVPVAKAVELAIRNAYDQTKPQENFEDWIQKQKIVVMGKGETAGKPIIDHLIMIGADPVIVDSKTQNPKEITKNADILISAVGKDKAVTPDMLKSGVILIGVGLHTDEEGKLRGDFHADEIRDIVSFYTPTPGGIGPMNVASLMQNLVQAAKA